MKKIVALFLFFAFATPALPSVAHAQLGNSFTADQARDARDKGNVVPLRDIFRQLKRRYGGYQVDANLYNRGGSMLRAGDIVMCGSFVRTQFPTAGQTVTCRVENLGEAVVTVE